MKFAAKQDDCQFLFDGAADNDQAFCCMRRRLSLTMICNIKRNLGGHYTFYIAKLHTKLVDYCRTRARAHTDPPICHVCELMVNV